MKLEIFKQADFIPSNAYLSIVKHEVMSAASHCADAANKILNDYIETHGVKVYGPSSSHVNWNVEQGSHDVYEAYLINITELKKECVEHEPYQDAIPCPDKIKGCAALHTRTICLRCGVKLKAKWEPV
jgi:hypothetical protein